MENLLKVQDVADMLGVDRASVYGMVFKKKIPCLKISGRLLRFSPLQLAEWLKNKAHAAGARQADEPKQQGTSNKPKRSKRSSRHGNAEVERIITMAKRDVTTS
jgi:excisionase family DNA binding protein